jgi:type IV secretory pathway VirB4 component
MRMQIAQYRHRARGLADLLLPFALIEDGVLLQQDGSLVAGWLYRGPDMHSATHAEMHALTMRLNSVLRLGSGWMIHADLIRSGAPGYPGEGAFPHAVTRVIDAERRQQFMDEGAHFESEYFLTLSYLPPLETEEKLKGWMFEGQRNGRAGIAQQTLDRFSASAEVAQSRNRTLLTYPSPGEVAASAAGQEVSEVGAQITRRNLNVQPTIKIPVGYRFNVRVNRDILFDQPYEPIPPGPR